MRYICVIAESDFAPLEDRIYAEESAGQRAVSMDAGWGVAGTWKTEVHGVNIDTETLLGPRLLVVKLRRFWRSVHPSSGCLSPFQVVTLRFF